MSSCLTYSRKKTYFWILKLLHPVAVLRDFFSSSFKKKSCEKPQVIRLEDQPNYCDVTRILCSDIDLID